MSFEFKEKDYIKIAKALGVPQKKNGKAIRYEVGQNLKKLALEIYPNIRIGQKRGSLISVYTLAAHLQLHFCTGYVVSSLLGEITFVGESNGKLCGLTIEKDGGCSLYANVDREILSGDFTNLGPEVMLSGIALSLVEGILPDVTVSSSVVKSDQKGAERTKSKKSESEKPRRPMKSKKI